MLQEGITVYGKHKESLTNDVHQPYWRLNLYLSAIIYMKSGEYGKMTSLLETAVLQPNAPNMIKSILANIYQKEKQYARSLKLWIDIYDSNDPSYQDRAAMKITQLKKLSGIAP